MLYAIGSRLGALAGRLRGERGQTATEYMGILLLVALVVFALVNDPIDVDGRIARAVAGIVDAVSSGGDPPSG